MTITTIYSGIDPSTLYLEALEDLIRRGKECAPRGKKIKELRPVVFEFLDPKKRVTFLNGRTINPFFQLAESYWILGGRSDVKWLARYNESIAQFSDDGKYFNAPYGERLRFWNKNDASGFIYCPIDQLRDVYKKIKDDPDTRQAVAAIYNPEFDNFYRKTKDRPCNLMLIFKLREGKLDLTVANRSNDLHWGVFGANLCQFTTIQATIAGWLGVEVGHYFQETDSLHIYTEDYGSKNTQDILDCSQSMLTMPQFYFPDEPQIEGTMDESDKDLQLFFGIVDSFIHNDSTYDTDSHELFASTIYGIEGSVTNRYTKNALYAMLAYQAHKLKANIEHVSQALGCMEDSSWKVACLRFLYKKYGEYEKYKEIYSGYNKHVIRYIERANG
jgi:thymidylate synthase